MSGSIRQKLLTIILPIIIFSWILAGAISYYDSKKEVSALLDAQLVQTGKVLLAMSTHELVEQKLLRDENANSAESIPRVFWEINSIYAQNIIFQIWLHNETLALHSDNAPIAPLTSKTGFTNISIGGNSWRIYSESTEDGIINVQIGIHGNVQQAFGKTVISNTFSLLLITVPVLIALLWIGMNKSFEPLKRVALELGQRKVNDLSPIDQYKVPTETRSMMTALNNLFVQMKTAFDTERRFTSDAAHELRTPLAALKTHAEIALQANNPEEQQKALRQVVQGVNRATRLVEQLLTLARLDPDTGITNIRRFDLFIEAENVLGHEAQLAIDKNIEISLSGTRGKFVAGNSDVLKVLMRNLIDNAIRYTPSGGEVQVHINRKDDNIIFTVADSGPGIPKEERSKVFNRFYRSLGTKESGSGLGLSIVTRIADLHHLTINLDTSKMGGLQIDVVFAAKDYDTIGQVVES